MPDQRETFEELQPQEGGGALKQLAGLGLALVGWGIGLTLARFGFTAGKAAALKRLAGIKKPATEVLKRYKTAAIYAQDKGGSFSHFASKAGMPGGKALADIRYAAEESPIIKSFRTSTKNKSILQKVGTYRSFPRGQRIELGRGLAAHYGREMAFVAPTFYVGEQMLGRLGWGAHQRDAHQGPAWWNIPGHAVNFARWLPGFLTIDLGARLGFGLVGAAKRATSNAVFKSQPLRSLPEIITNARRYAKDNLDSPVVNLITSTLASVRAFSHFVGGKTDANNQTKRFAERSYKTISGYRRTGATANEYITENTRRLFKDYRRFKAKAKSDLKRALSTDYTRTGAELTRLFDPDAAKSSPIHIFKKGFGVEYGGMREMSRHLFERKMPLVARLSGLESLRMRHLKGIGQSEEWKRIFRVIYKGIQSAREFGDAGNQVRKLVKGGYSEGGKRSFDDLIVDSRLFFDPVTKEVRNLSGFTFKDIIGRSLHYASKRLTFNTPLGKIDLVSIFGGRAVASYGMPSIVRLEHGRVPTKAIQRLYGVEVYPTPTDPSAKQFTQVLAIKDRKSGYTVWADVYGGDASGGTGLEVVARNMSLVSSTDSTKMMSVYAMRESMWPPLDKNALNERFKGGGITPTIRKWLHNKFDLFGGGKFYPSVWELALHHMRGDSRVWTIFHPEGLPARVASGIYKMKDLAASGGQKASYQIQYLDAAYRKARTEASKLLTRDDILSRILRKAYEGDTIKLWGVKTEFKIKDIIDEKIVEDGLPEPLRLVREILKIDETASADSRLGRNLKQIIDELTDRMPEMGGFHKYVSEGGVGETATVKAKRFLAERAILREADTLGAARQLDTPHAGDTVKNIVDDILVAFDDLAKTNAITTKDLLKVKMGMQGIRWEHEVRNLGSLSGKSQITGRGIDKLFQAVGERGLMAKEYKDVESLFDFLRKAKMEDPELWDSYRRMTGKFKTTMMVDSQRHALEMMSDVFGESPYLLFEGGPMGWAKNVFSWGYDTFGRTMDLVGLGWDRGRFPKFMGKDSIAGLWTKRFALMGGVAAAYQTVDTVTDTTPIFAGSLAHDELVAVRHKRTGLVSLVKIGEFVEDGRADNNQFEAWTNHGGKIGWYDITQGIRHKRETTLVRVELESGADLFVTDNHSLFTGSESNLQLQAPEVGKHIVALESQYPSGAGISRVDISDLVTSLPEKLYVAVEDPSLNRGNYKLRADAEDIWGSNYVRWLRDRVTYHKAVYRTTYEAYTECPKKEFTKIRHFRSPVKIPSGWELTREFGYVLGMFAAEGCATKSNGSVYGVLFSAKDYGSLGHRYKGHIRSRLVSALKTVFPDAKISHSHKKIILHGYLYYWLFHDVFKMGHGASNKRLPDFALNGPEGFRRGLIDGYIDGDGYQKQTGDTIRPAGIGSTSRELVTQVYLLLRMEGCQVKLSSREPRQGQIIDGRVVNGNYRTYAITIRDLHTDLYDVSNSNHARTIRSNRVSSAIASMSACEEQPDFVYDISVAGAEKFIAGFGFLYAHNTALDEGTTVFLADQAVRARLFAGYVYDITGITDTMKYLEGLMPKSTQVLPGAAMGFAMGGVPGAITGGILNAWTQPVLKEGPLSFLSLLPPTAPFVSDMTKSFKELQDLYSGRELEAVRKGSGWPFGSVPIEGCLTERTEVLVADGGTTSIRAIKVGDCVIGPAGPVLVTATKDRYTTPSEQLYTIISRYNRSDEVEITGNHPVLVAEDPFRCSVVSNGTCSPRRNQKCHKCSHPYWQSYKLGWKRADDITSDDLLAIPRRRFNSSSEHVIRWVDFLGDDYKYVGGHVWVNSKLGTFGNEALRAIVDLVLDDLPHKDSEKQRRIEAIATQSGRMPRQVRQKMVDVRDRLRDGCPRDCIDYVDLGSLAEYLPLSYETGRFLGLYAAEGSVCDNGTISFAFHANEIEYHQFVESCMRRYFGSDTVTHVSGPQTAGTNQWAVQCFSTPIASILGRMFNRGASSKDIPARLFEANDDFLRGFLRGLFDGDGHHNLIKPRVEMRLASKDLINQVQLVLEHFGVVGFVSQVDNNGFDAYEILVSSSNARALLQLMEGVHESTFYDSLPGKGAWVCGDFIFTEVHKISSRSCPEGTHVYDIEVAEGESFRTVGLHLHNSRITAYSPNWYPMLKAQYKATPALYGSKLEQWAFKDLPFVDFSFGDLIDPDYLTRKHYYDRPYISCLTPGTLIIGDRITAIDKIREGSHVYTKSGELSKVTEVHRRNVKEHITNIRIAKHSEPLRLTWNHKVMVMQTEVCSHRHNSSKSRRVCRFGLTNSDCVKCTNKLYKNYELGWVRAKHIEPGDIVVKSIPDTSEIVESINISDFVLDYPVYDGSVYYAPRANKLSAKLAWIKAHIPQHKDNEKGALKRLSAAYDIPLGYLYNHYYTCNTNQWERWTIPDALPLDKNLFTILGYYLAEGSLTTKGVSFVFHEKELNTYVKELINAASNLGFKSSSWRYKEGSKAIELTIYSVILRKMVDSLCGRAEQKHIHSLLMKAPRESRIAFVRSYINGDGCYTAVDRGIWTVTYTSVVPSISYQIQQMLSTLGVFAGIHKSECPPYKIKINDKVNGISSGVYYIGTINGVECRKLLDLFEMDHPQTNPPAPNRWGWMDNKFIYLAVRNVDREYYEGPVYDITVDGEHNYQTSSAIVHNSDIPFLEVPLVGPALAATAGQAFRAIHPMTLDHPMHKEEVQRALQEGVAYSWRGEEEPGFGPRYTGSVYTDESYSQGRIMGTLEGRSPTIRSNMDVRQIISEQIYRGWIEPAGLAGFCLPEGSEVITYGGLYKKVEDINLGDKLITHRGHPGKVTRVYKRFVDEDIIELSVSHYADVPVQLTGEHPVLVAKTKPCLKTHDKQHCLPLHGSSRCYCCPREFNTNLEWVVAKDIKEGDFVVQPSSIGLPHSGLLDLGKMDEVVNYKRVNNNSRCSRDRDHKYFVIEHDNIRWWNGSKKRFPRYLELTKDLGFFFGVYLAEGSLDPSPNKVNKHNRGPERIQFALHKDETDAIGRRLIRIAREYFNIDPSKCHITPNHGNGIRLRLQSHAQLAITMHLLLGSKENKYLHPSLSNGPTKFIIGLLEGLLIGDGCAFNNENLTTITPTISLTTTAYGIVQAVRYAMTRIGLHPPVTTRDDSIVGRKTIINSHVAIHKLPSYRLRLSGYTAVKLNQLIHLYSGDGDFNYKPIRKKAPEVFTLYDYTYLKVKKVVSKRYKGRVYDFEIGGDHSFMTTACIVHNCTSALLWDSDEPFVDEPVFAPASEMDSMGRAYWDMNIGDPFLIGEGIRRMIPRPRTSYEKVDDLLRNDMPGWLPENFRRGDPFCISPDTMVEVYDGLIRADGVKEGDLIRTIRGRYFPINKIAVREVDEPVYKIKLAGVEYITTATAEHPFRIHPGKWALAEDLRPGMYVAYPRLKIDFPTELEILGRRFQLSGPLAYILGNVLKYGRVGDLSLAVTGVPEGDSFARTVQNILGIKLSKQGHSRSKILLSLFKDLNLRLPPMFYGGPLNIFASFLKPFTDEPLPGRRFITLTLPNMSLAYQVWNCLIQHDVIGQIDGCQITIPRWMLVGFNKNAVLIDYLCGDREILRYGDISTIPYKKHERGNDDHLYIRVDEVEEIHYKGPVYGFEVDRDNTFCVAGCISHNTRIPRGEALLPGPGYESMFNMVLDFPTGASRLGYSAYEQALHMIGLKDPLSEDEEEIMSEGTAIHKMVQAQLTKEGVLKKVEAYVTDPYNRVSSYVDGVMGSAYGDIPLEIKSISSKGFQQLTRPKHKHNIQLNAYLHMMKAREGKILYVNRTDPSQTKEFKVRYDPRLWAQTLAELETAREYASQFLGEGYGSSTNGYSYVDRMQVLMNAAPFSTEYREVAQIVGQQSELGLLSDEQENHLKRMRRYHQNMMRRHELYPHRFKWNQILDPDPQYQQLNSNELIKAAAEYPLPARVAGSIWEYMTHLRSPLHSKLIGQYSPEEQYERTVLYGSTHKNWANPISDFAEPYMRGLKSVTDPVQGALSFGLGGSLFGGLPGAILAGTFGAVYGSAHGIYRAATDSRYVPERFEEMQEMEEYFDRLKYYRSHTLYKATGDRRFLDEMGRTAVGWSAKTRGGRMTRQRREDDTKRSPYANYARQPTIYDITGNSSIYTRMMNWMGGVLPPEGMTQSSRWANQSYSTAGGTNRGHMSPWSGQDTERDLGFSANEENLLDYSGAYAAMPYWDRPFFNAFLTTPYEKREDILGTVDRTLASMLQAAWGHGEPDIEGIGNYFEDHYQPPAGHPIMLPGAEFEDYKYETIDQAGLAAHDFGLGWRDQLRRIQSSPIDIKPVNINAEGPSKKGLSLDAGQIKQSMHQILARLGYQSTPVKVSTTESLTDSVSLRVNIKRDSTNQIINLHTESMRYGG